MEWCERVRLHFAAKFQRRLCMWGSGHNTVPLLLLLHLFSGAFVHKPVQLCLACAPVVLTLHLLIERPHLTRLVQKNTSEICNTIMCKYHMYDRAKRSNRWCKDDQAEQANPFQYSTSFFRVDPPPFMLLKCTWYPTIMEEHLIPECEFFVLCDDLSLFSDPRSTNRY